MSDRTKNFTEREKAFLVNLVDKYKHIIENKNTNAGAVCKKQDTWAEISVVFNAEAEQARTPKQLRNLYLNLKRLTRKKVADDNVKDYTEKIQPGDVNLKDVKKKFIMDKKEINKTGGGAYTPQTTEVEMQMLALIGEQTRPLHNNCDSAVDFYGSDSIDKMEESAEKATNGTAADHSNFYTSCDPCRLCTLCNVTYVGLSGLSY